MEEIFENVSTSINRGSLALSAEQNLIEYGDSSQYMHDYIKILPPKMIFTDAFDGKQYKKSFKIMNCGKYPAFVRIFPPTSQAFRMKPLRRGRYLPSGLSVTRTINYTHTSAMALSKACLFVFINEKQFTYQIEVHLISAYVKVYPKVLNFGEIDVGNASQQLTLQLKNIGHRLAQFSVDLGRNDLELIIDPMKGTILPDGSVNVNVEVLGSQMGSFNNEFWVKTEPPRRVQLTGVFIPPKIVIEYPVSNTCFTMVDFPKTYYGAQSVRTVIISNYSSTDRMFCLVTERGHELEYLRSAQKTNDNLKCFSSNCFEGRLLARQNYVLRFTFKPLKLDNFSRKYCQAFIRVAEVNYRDGVVAERDECVKTFTSASSIEEFLASPIENLEEFDDINIPDANYIRFCLYGEMEKPSIQFSPTDFTLSYLQLEETYDRILNIKNNSRYLPIVFRSSIVPCVKMRPSEVFLSPEESLEITLSITPSEEGTRNYKIIFDLLHYISHKEYKVGSVALPIQFSATKAYPKVEPKFNMGITPAVTHEVGFLVDEVRFNSKIDKPIQAIVDKNHKSFNEKNTGLIAFPNDMPKCLRPWRSKVPCRTIFSNRPRIVSDQDEYTLTVQEVEKKEHNAKIYDDYIKKLAEIRPRWQDMKLYVPQDYETTDKSHLLLEKLPLSQEIIQPEYRYGCIALPPEKLMEVNIKPKYVHLGKIAPYTMCTDSFSIENRNQFSINVAIKALSNTVVIKGKSRIMIGPQDTRNIFFDCFSHGYGKFYVPVYIIINDYHIFDGTVFASVVPTTVKCDQKEIIVNPKTHRSFFEMFNPVNCDIMFAWEIQDKNFKVIPDSGVVPSRKSVMCSIMFIPQINATYKTEIYLHSQSGAKQIITVVCKNERATIGFSTDKVEFYNTPLNITIVKHVVLRNFSDEEIMYLVENPNPLEEITVSPAVGNINAKSDVDFCITVHFKDVIAFNCPITFVMQDVYSYTISIVGNVVFPTVHIAPQHFQIPKVPLGCYQRLSFRMKNTSLATNVITFHLDDIPEFSVTDLQHKPIKEATLQPDEAREMILEFKPAEPVAYSLYLPYKMNDIIGPPLLNDPRTLRPEYYFMTGNVSIKRATELPKMIKTLNIKCAASTSWFTFSTLNLFFNYEPKTRCRKRFSITNISTTEYHFRIPVLNTKYPFSIKWERKTDHELSEDSWKFVIEPKDTVSFRIEYIPTEYGNCTTELPLYVEEYLNQCPFNYLKLSGVYSKPVIIADSSVLYFQAITAKEKIGKKITLKLDFHERDCVVNIVIQHETLSVKHLRTTDSGKSTNAISCSVSEYIIKFHPKRECIVSVPIVFSCSCDAVCEILIRASADNCIFCSYQSFIKAGAISENEKFESTFPFFPVPGNKSYYARTIVVIKEDIERWLFSQGFFYMNFYKIPYGLARIPVHIQPRIEESKNTNHMWPKAKVEKVHLVLPLVKLLVNLMGPSVTKYFYKGTSEQTFHGPKGVIYVYTVYKNIIEFLEAQGVFVSQLKPEYLLPHHKYVIYKEDIAIKDTSAEKIFSADDFMYFTKQVWLDLILRIYRVFLYNRATNPFVASKIKAPPKPRIYEEELAEHFVEKRGDFDEDVNESERKLIIWLQFHFDRQKSVLWDERTNAKLKNRKIRSFEKDLADSLPFATLMMAYCPYMRKCFDNFFPLYQNNEDMYHNACIIYETWKRLRLSYELRPIRITKPSVTEMEILMSYLYDVLPNFYPTETIIFNTSLGDVSVNKLVLKNQGDAVIAYTPLFFLNDTEAFSVNAEVVTISPGGTSTLKVSYKAKSILKKTAVLVLSGETIGYKFAKTMAFNLVGIPNIFEYTEEFSFKVEVFKQMTKTLEVASPFEIAYEAKLYVFLGDQTKAPETLEEFVSISSTIKQNLPRHICMEPECRFDSDGSAEIHLDICFVACGEWTYFFYFSNKDVGDFCIKINFKATLPPRRTVDLSVNLSRHFSTEKCTCSLSTIDPKCPRMIIIDLPSKNQQLIEGLKALFRNCSEEDSKFWSPLLDYPKGFHVLGEYLENTFDDNLVPFKAVLQQQVTYEIHTKIRKKITMAKYVTIDDVTSSRPYKLEMHWNSKQWPENQVLTLVADHEQEMRRYILRFVKPQRPKGYQ